MVSGWSPDPFYAHLRVPPHVDVKCRLVKPVSTAQTTLEIINNVFLIHNWKFTFLYFELPFDLLTCINRLNISINLSTEVTELVSLTAFADFWSLKG